MQDIERIESLIDCPHTLRCLHRAGVETIEQLQRMRYDDLLALRGIGPVIATDVVRLLDKRAGGEGTTPDTHCN